MIVSAKIMDMDQELKKLTPKEKEVIIGKGTEKPFSGKYYKHKEKGVYVCKKCGAELYRSDDKFDYGCGWPSFDDAIEGAIKMTSDHGDKKMEVTCVNCGGHLGHVFKGEGITEKNVRYCVNSISLDFKKIDEK